MSASVAGWGTAASLCERLLHILRRLLEADAPHLAVLGASRPNDTQVKAELINPEHLASLHAGARELEEERRRAAQVLFGPAVAARLGGVAF